MTRTKISGNSLWEATIGYCRAVRVGSVVYVAGTTATDDAGEIVGVGDAYAQTVQAGASLADVVRTRMFVTDTSRWQEVGRAHGEFFRDVRPAATMVEVSRLIDPRMLVEIEVEAVVDER